MVVTGHSTAGAIPVRSLAAMLRDDSSGVCRRLRALHPEPGAFGPARDVCLSAVEAFAGRFGADASVFVVRSAGRVNLVGMHIDHRGGYVNPIAVKDVFFVVQPRADDRVHMCNAEEVFPPAGFSISRELPGGKIQDWEAWSHEQFEARTRRGRAGEWSNYVKAAVLYLQHLHTRPDGTFEPPLRGMNLAVASNLPRAAGLSSSSAIVVGVMEACLAVNGIAMDPMQMIEACRVGEWYVGTRGGGGDHAAIRLGRAGHILRVGSFPLTVDSVPFPDSCSLVLANSLVEARKQEGARDIFNQRVACYVFGLQLLRRRFPHLAPRMEHLRDVNPQTLGVSEADIYRMMLALPERCSRAELLQALPEDGDLLERTFRTHAEPPDGYMVRQVCLYGVAECARSGMAAEMLRRGDVRGFGELIDISHEGDRVTRAAGSRRVPVEGGVSDARLQELIRDAESGDPQRVERARLWRQPGGYCVSTPEQDALVDIARSVPGVLGAGLVGAGLGGCIIVLVERDRAGAVISALAERYYGPRGLTPSAEVVEPAEGARVLEFGVG